MKNIPYYIIVVFMVVATLAGCDDYDKFTTATDARLSFNMDSVRFDTIITGLSSTTRTLIVRNANDRGIRINRVALGQGSDSHFRVNVDGQYLYGGVGAEFEVRRKDSIYVRLEVTVPESQSELVERYTDRLDFTLENGQTQSIGLRVDGLNVIVVHGLDVTKDTTLQADRPILIYDSLVVQKEKTLTLAPGTTLMFHDKVNLDVHGTLKAIGTQAEPITLRGDRVDRMFDYLPYDNTPNRWGGVHFYGDSHDNELTQCDIHSGDYGIVCDSTLDTPSIEHPMLRMTNSVVHNVGGVGLQLHDCISQIVGCQISNTLGHCVDILGGGHDFVHCTIAQFYPFSANGGDALHLANAVNNDGNLYHELGWAYFLNCVITGYAEDVIMGSIVENNEYHCDYKFANSFLRTVVSNDADRFVNIIYDDDKQTLKNSENFTLFDTTNFLYDFTPKEDSPIRGLADMEYTRTYSLTDRLGRDRLQDGAPDAGAYELVATSQP